MEDVIIIGAGITGCLIARALSFYHINTLVIEKNADVANGASGANSAIVHSGHDPKPGTLKAEYNLRGSRMYKQLCHDLKVAYKQVGAYVVACSSEEQTTLKGLVQQCVDRQIPHSVLTGEQAREKEKNLSDNVVEALALPTTAIITPWEVCIAAMEEAMLNGVSLHLEETVTSIKKEEHFTVTTDKGIYESKYVIDCAGVHADDIAAMLNIHNYKITARRGEYFILDHQKTPFIQSVIYPVPSDKGKGVLVVPTIHNNILIGPNSSFKDEKDRVNTAEGLDEVKKEINKTVKNIPWNLQIHTYAGNRPTGDTYDFVIGEDKNVSNFIHVSCIESPGLASAPAIAQDVSQIIIKKENARKQMIYHHRKAHINMADLSDEKKNELIKKNPDYGKIVCRCERITLGEIKDVIHRECGATSVKGVKRRCRPGMGRCQGGFCEPDVVQILKDELHIELNEVLQDKKNSNIFVKCAKED